MPSFGQSITICYLAFDQSAKTGKTGDVANHTLRLVKDGVSAAPSNAPAEVDATNAPGIYSLVLTTAEAQHNVVILCGKSSTANITIAPVQTTFEVLPTVTAGAANGLVINGSNTGPLSISGGVTFSNSTGDAFALSSSGSNGNGINVSGNGSGAGILTTGGGTGAAFKLVGGSTSGDGINATCTLGHGANIRGGGSAKHGIIAVSGSGGSSGDGIQAASLATNGAGLRVVGGGTGAGINATGGATGNGVSIFGGGTSGVGLQIFTTNGDGFYIQPASGHGMNINGNGTSKHGIAVVGGTAGTSDGINIVAGTGGTDMRVPNITGTLATVTTATNLSAAAYQAVAQAIYGCTGTVWFVGTNGNDSNAGTSASPFLTVAHAWSVAALTDLIVIGPGTFTDATAAVTITCSAIGMGPYTTIIKNAYTAGGGSTTTWTANDGAKLSNLTLQSTAAGNSLITFTLVLSTASNATCYLEDVRLVGKTDCIYMTGVNQNIRGNRVRMETNWDAIFFNATNGGSVELENSTVISMGPQTVGTPSADWSTGIGIDSCTGNPYVLLNNCDLQSINNGTNNIAIHTDSGIVDVIGGAIEVSGATTLLAAKQETLGVVNLYGVNSDRTKESGTINHYGPAGITLSPAQAFNNTGQTTALPTTSPIRPVSIVNRPVTITD